MRTRNTFISLTVLALGVLFLLSLQSHPTKSLAATVSATTAGTPEDVTAQCEALRTIPVAAATAVPTTEGTQAAPASLARPSNPGGPGPALKLIGNTTAGQKVFVDNCQKCHGDQGIGDIANPGSDDGTIPALNPIDDSIKDVDPAVYACYIDVFIEHGSVPSGPSPKETMQPWGDNKVLTAQQISDVIAYVITLNGGTPATAVATPAK